MENVRTRIDVRLVSNKKYYLKCTSKLSYISHKIIDNDLITIRQNKVALKPNKPAYTGICVLELSKAIENKYDNKSKLLFTDTNRLMYEDFRNTKEMVDINLW